MYLADGYRYDIAVLNNGKGLDRKGKTYQHTVTLPDGTRQELPFSKRYRVTSDKFILWVDLHTEKYAHDFEGHRYIPERDSDWRLVGCRYRHRVRRADGTSIFAPFWPPKVMTAQAFAFWVTLGFPDAARFGRDTLTNTFMDKLRETKDEFNVDDQAVETLMMLHAFKTKG